MNLRFDYAKAYPAALRAMLDLEEFTKSGGIDSKLRELIKIRASQINGCAFCIHMHAKDARAAGEEEKRIYLLNAWKESPYYTEKERAALEVTEYVTKISQEGLPEHVYANARTHFDEKEFVALVMLINTINSWNRIAITTGKQAPL
ncbi:carboxymuconolactone decarboxylase family protein [Leptospira fainei serovar Hurstbridge str. BUT 6]|uniref:Carboxymuconolactone decarboxylase family protein n=1 Tax=Leptospira fainei serovar Hurstbridge str. BUT 6 TaxID=1193011 RepID=S3UZE6_9LEPT|nr:carboxymuconolactone decarboxylase family protein [Leptospira fainei]EPG74568.1 carboxymuconolactone decarboxylase family protein [Leptospira fainei serovar Hurstbridge str. BUT 6]